MSKTRFDPGFAIVPVGVVDAWPKLSASAKGLVVAIASFSDGQEAYPSRETLCIRAGISPRQPATFARALRELKERHLVEIPGRRVGGRSLTGRYRWTPEALHKGQETPASDAPLSGEKPLRPTHKTPASPTRKPLRPTHPEQIVTDREQISGGRTASGRVTGPGRPSEASGRVVPSVEETRRRQVAEYAKANLPLPAYLGGDGASPGESAVEAVPVTSKAADGS